MQEEVENRTVNIVITTTRLTMRTLMDGIRKYLNQSAHMKQSLRERKAGMKVEAKQRRLEQKKTEGPHGKQTVKQLVHHSNGLKQVPVQGDHLKEFERILRKYGVDFAVMKETGDAPRYLVFFKAKDEQVLSSVLAESTKRQLNKANVRKKPSLLMALKEAKELAASVPAKTRQKEKDLSL